MFWLRNCTRIKTLFHLSTELMSAISSFVTLPLHARHLNEIMWLYYQVCEMKNLKQKVEKLIMRIFVLKKVLPLITQIPLCLKVKPQKRKPLNSAHMIWYRHHRLYENNVTKNTKKQWWWCNVSLFAKCILSISAGDKKKRKEI